MLVNDFLDLFSRSRCHVVCKGFFNFYFLSKYPLFAFLISFLSMYMHRFGTLIGIKEQAPAKYVQHGRHTSKLLNLAYSSN